MAEIGFVGQIFLGIGAAILLSGLVIGLAIGWRRTRPIKFKLDYLPAAKNGHLGLEFNFEKPGTNAIGKIGELLTALMFVHNGWSQLPSQPNGIHKVDGIFVRRKGGGFQVAFVETKSTTDPYDPVTEYEGRRMTHEELAKDVKSYPLEPTPHMPDHVANALVGALQRNSAHVQKYLYAHEFPTGKTHIYRVKRDGSLKVGDNVVEGDEHQRLCQALAIGVQRLLPWHEGVKERGVAMKDSDSVIIVKGKRPAPPS